VACASWPNILSDMECGRFRDLRAIHGKTPLPKEVWETAEHAAWTDHLHACAACSDWELGCRVIERGFDPASFPCVHIADQVTQHCEQHPDPRDCPDALVISVRSGEYGLPIRDGGSSASVIAYCPWCGTALKTEVAR
jgi:hypothetical protein